MADSQFPQNRKVWDVTDIEAGEYISSDDGQMSQNQKVDTNSSGPIEFGTFVTTQGANTGNVGQASDGDSIYEGVAMINQQSPEFDLRRQPINTIAEIAKRGFVTMKIIPGQPPLAFTGELDFVYVSGQAATAGYLTNVATGDQKISVNTEGVRVLRVGKDVAEVYLSGKPLIVVTDVI